MRLERFGQQLHCLFRLLLIALAALIVPPFQSTHASVMSSRTEGDLAIFRLGYHSNSQHSAGPTLFLLLDPSLYAGPNSSQRIQSFQQAIEYLMDTPGLMADNLQVGIGKQASPQPGDRSATLALVPLTALGKVSDSHHPGSQRYKIKKFINNHCAQYPVCGIDQNARAVMNNSAAAYAEAAAYMMGTNTQSSVVNLQLQAEDVSNREYPLDIMDIRNTHSPSLLSQPVYTADSANQSMTLTERNIEPVFSENSRPTQYPLPNYNQCSAQYIGENSAKDTEASNASSYTVDNAIVVISSQYPQSHSEPFTDASNRSTINGMATMAQSLRTEPEPFPLNNETPNRAVLSEQCLSPAFESEQGSAQYWQCVHQYARRLAQLDLKQNGEQNPLGLSIKTAVISFNNTDHILSFNGVEQGLPNYDCFAARSEDHTRQRCLQGKYGQLNGEGGFFQSIDSPSSSINKTAVNQSRELAQALMSMADNLTKNSPPMAMTRPIQLVNPMFPRRLFTEGYLPFVHPKLGSTPQQWSDGRVPAFKNGLKGGVRKYSNSAAGFRDKNNQLGANQPPEFRPIIGLESKDLWSKRMTELAKASEFAEADEIYDSDKIENNSLPANHLRNVYLSQAQSGPLIPQTLQSLSKLKLPYEVEAQLQPLQQWLGRYLTKNQSTTTGVYHSPPIALVSRASPIVGSNSVTTIQPAGFSFKKHVVYGGMDGALHIIDDDTGEEVAAYFSKEVLADRVQHNATGSAPHGIAAPWTQYVRYVDAKNGDRIAKPLYVFGGAGLGSRAYYGLDLTGLDKVTSARSLNGFVPKQLFSLTPSRQDYGQLFFQRLGYSWGKPVITHINWLGVPTLVAIFSGGYDSEQYDKPDGLRERHYRQQDKISALGNAIYIVDAKTGVPLIVSTSVQNVLGSIQPKDNKGFTGLPKAGGNVLQITHPALNYSITGAVKVMDRDSDGLADHLYFADLEGQVFRLDIDNVASSKTLASKGRVIRLADFRVADNQPGPRFYETPVVTLQTHNSAYGDAIKFATVSVASGDRSNLLRITDPSKQTVAFELEYLSSLGGHKQTIKATRNDFIVSKDKASTLGHGRWQLSWTDPVLNMNNNSSNFSFDHGKIKLANQLIKPGSLIKAVTTFTSTDQVAASMRLPNLISVNNQQNKMPEVVDPLAPLIVNTEKWVSIEPMSTAKLSTLSQAPNYVYTLYDKDIASANLFSTATAKLLTHDIIVTEDGFPDITKIETLSPQLSGYHKQGWRASLTQTGQLLNPEHAQSNNQSLGGSKRLTPTLSNINPVLNSSLKAFGPMVAVSNHLYLTVYDPIPSSPPLQDCQPQVIGSTEVYQFCLPFGNCNTKLKTFAQHSQRIRYAKGLAPLSWKTDHTGLSRQLLKVSNFGAETETTDDIATEDPLQNLNDIKRAPVFRNTFTIEPQIKLKQWFDYSNHLATSK